MLDNTVLLVDYVYNVYEIKCCYLLPTLLLCQITQFLRERQGLISAQSLKDTGKVPGAYPGNRNRKSKVC